MVNSEHNGFNLRSFATPLAVKRTISLFSELYRKHLYRRVSRIRAGQATRQMRHVLYPHPDLLLPASERGKEKWTKEERLIYWKRKLKQLY